ncbi:peptidase, partial [Bacillus thuringiensis serovar darmstadiensis]
FFTKYELNVINIVFVSKLEYFHVVIAVLHCLRCVQNYTI